MKRRRKKNPEPVTIILLLGGAALAAVGGFALFGKRKALVTTTGQTFTPSNDVLELGAFTSAEGILSGDCILAKQGAAGLNVPGISSGENIPMKVVSSGGASANFVIADSIDPRSPGVRMTVPVGAISGAGECVVGF